MYKNNAINEKNAKNVDRKFPVGNAEIRKLNNGNKRDWSINIFCRNPAMWYEICPLSNDG